MLYLVGNIDLKWHRLNLILKLLSKLNKIDIFGYDYIIDYWSVWFLSEKVCIYGSILADMLCENAQWNWLITADNCKKM